jgi:hypothetical protein
MKPFHPHSALRLGGVVAGLLVLTGGATAQTNTVGLSTVRLQRFGNENLALLYTPQAGDRFASSLVAGDFNGDGADDLVTGMEHDDGSAWDPLADSGNVVVRYGIAGSGLATPLATDYLRQLDVSEAGDGFGRMLAACDLNGDSYDDLVIGMPLETYLGHKYAGIVQVHYGTSEGLPLTGDRFFAQSTPGLPEDVDEYDWFGESLACGDFDADSFDDLVIGAPGEEWGLLPAWGKGMITIVPGSTSGLAFAQAFGLSQDSDGMAGDAESGDYFGDALAAGDFDGDGYDDLAVGVPGEELGAGVVHFVFGGPTGLRGGRNFALNESFDDDGTSDDGDVIYRLATGDVDGDGFADLVVGSRSDSVGTARLAGSAVVLHGGVDGFNRAQRITELDLYGPGTSEQDDLFGFPVVLADFNRDGFDDLVVGHSGETVLGPGDGAATILRGSPNGLDLTSPRSIVAGVKGIPGDPSQTGERFAFSLAAGDFDGDGHADLAVGSPRESENGIADVGAEVVLYGALFADGVESGNTALWPQTVTSPGNNEITVTSAARLGPPTSRRGIALSLINPDFRRPGFPAYVRVGPEAGFANETVLEGSFFMDPQNLTMSTTPGNNSFQVMAFNDGVAAGARTRLVFFLVRNPADGDWFLTAFHFNDNLGTFQLSGSGFFAADGDPSFANTRIEFAWRAGSPGQLTMWRTLFRNGAPGPRVEMFSASLPGMRGVINHAFAGVFAGHRPGTFGTLYLDEISFRRSESLRAAPPEGPPRR